MQQDGVDAQVSNFSAVGARVGDGKPIAQIPAAAGDQLTAGVDFATAGCSG